MKRSHVKPPVRWLGGKTQLLTQLQALMPSRFGRYHEPFLGGGALFFATRPAAASLTDTNHRLVNAFACIKDDVDGLVAHLKSFERSKGCYHAQRELLNAEPAGLNGTAAAARFVFLNKTCFNGLWRENAAGSFNTPYGGDSARRFLDEEGLRACASLLRATDVHLAAEDFGDVTARAQPGDLVYFDPPYVPVSATSFVDYTSDGFGWADQVRLRNIAVGLRDAGVNVMVSNSDTPLTRELYKGFELHEVQARRSVNSNGAGRGKVGELIIR